MRQTSSESSLVAHSPSAPDGPILECGGESGDNALRIHARRTFAVSREELFGAWTQRHALDTWLRLRSRSRVMLSPSMGGSLRLELSEGPTIHVITGVVVDVRPSEFLALSWVHQSNGDHTSSVSITFRERNRRGELTLLHSGIGNRREAAWLMHLWTKALGRLAGYFAETTPLARSA